MQNIHILELRKGSKKVVVVVLKPHCLPPDPLEENPSGAE